MSQFDTLVRKQLITMDKLLFLQTEIERCQEIEKELLQLQKLTEMTTIIEEIQEMKAELREIQRTFEQQTEEVISLSNVASENKLHTAL